MTARPPEAVADWRLRPATAADLDFAWRIYREAAKPLAEAVMPWREAAQREAVARALASGEAQVIEAGGAPAGWLQVHEDAEALGLRHLYLAAAARGRGLGSAVIAALCERAAAAGKPLRLTVLARNPARGLYARLGFRETGTLDGKVVMEWRPVGGAGRSRSG